MLMLLVSVREGGAARSRLANNSPTSSETITLRDARLPKVPPVIAEPAMASPSEDAFECLRRVILEETLQLAFEVLDLQGIPPSPEVGPELVDVLSHGVSSPARADRSLSQIAPASSALDHTR